MSLPLTHIERDDQSETECVRKMLCGESCIVLGEWITHPGFDFYSFAHGHKATCAACQTERLRLTNTKTMAEA
jgi:hypothetical protein